jgi:hypothetical protein
MTPAAVARAFLADVAAMRWLAAAEHLDLDAFEGYRGEQIGQLRSQLPMSLTAEDLMQADPDMPRAVAEYQVRKAREAQARFGNGIGHQFAGVSRLDSLAALSPAEAAARFLEAQDPRYLMRRSLEMQGVRGCPVPIDSLPPSPPRVVLGEIVRDSLAYVLHEEPSRPARDIERDSLRHLTRPHSPPARSWYAEPPAVLQLRLVGGRWRIFGGFGILENSGGVMFAVECLPKR